MSAGANRENKTERKQGILDKLLHCLSFSEIGRLASAERNSDCTAAHSELFDRSRCCG
jgi:hypothetical protein